MVYDIIFIILGMLLTYTNETKEKPPSLCFQDILQLNVRWPSCLLFPDFHTSSWALRNLKIYHFLLGKIPVSIWPLFTDLCYNIEKAHPKLIKYEQELKVLLTIKNCFTTLFCVSSCNPVTTLQWYILETGLSLTNGWIDKWTYK